MSSIPSWQTVIGHAYMADKITPLIAQPLLSP
jgi:hypothetical protein